MKWWAGRRRRDSPALLAPILATCCWLCGRSTLTTGRGNTLLRHGLLPAEPIAPGVAAALPHHQRGNDLLSDKSTAKTLEAHLIML